MKICILGYSGFLGSHLSNYLSKKFTIKKIDLRKLPQKNSDGFDKFLDEIVYSNIIINCALRTAHCAMRTAHCALRTSKPFPNLENFP